MGVLYSHSQHLRDGWCHYWRFQHSVTTDFLTCKCHIIVLIHLDCMGSKKFTGNGSCQAHCAHHRGPPNIWLVCLEDTWGTRWNASTQSPISSFNVISVFTKVPIGGALLLLSQHFEEVRTWQRILRPEPCVIHESVHDDLEWLLWPADPMEF